MAVVKKDDSNLQVAVKDSAGPTPKRKQKVLEEDEYLDKLGQIIQRDFFPELPKLRAQNEYLDAVQRNDLDKIRELQMRYSTRRRTDQINRTPRETPTFFETPDVSKKSDEEDLDSKKPSTSNEPQKKRSKSEEKEKPKDGPESLRIDQFVSKFTSEDNSSFDELIEIQQKKQYERLKWMFQKKDAKDGPLPLPETVGLADNRHLALEHWKTESKNPVIFYPEGVDFSPEEKIQRAKLAKREIEHSNTRFEKMPWIEDTTQNSVKSGQIIQGVLNKGKYDVTGQEFGLKPPQLHDLDPVATPSPAPGVDQTPFMTWGEIEGTPFLLDASDVSIQKTSGPVFKMPEIPERDEIAAGLAEQFNREHRKRKEKAMRRAAANFSPLLRPGSSKSVERLNTMSPAARSLASSKLGIRVGTDKALKASYTPSPLTKSGQKFPATPKSFGFEAQDRQSTPGSGPSSITDNLLRLGSEKKTKTSGNESNRAKASDFF